MKVNVYLLAKSESSINVQYTDLNLKLFTIQEGREHNLSRRGRRLSGSVRFLAVFYCVTFDPMSPAAVSSVVA